jgi:hypothetical protein
MIELILDLAKGMFITKEVTRQEFKLLVPMRVAIPE